MTAYLVRDTVKEVIVIPLLYAYGYLRFYFESVPQAIIWLAVVVSCAVIAVASFRRGSAESRRRRFTIENRVSRVEALCQWISLSSTGSYYNWRLANHLGGILLKIIELNTGTAENERSRTGNLEAVLSDPELSLPAEIESFLRSGVSLSGVHSGGTRPGLIAWLARRLPGTTQNQPRLSRSNLRRIAHTVSYLEDKIGGTHDT